MPLFTTTPLAITLGVSLGDIATFVGAVVIVFVGSWAIAQFVGARVLSRTAMSPGLRYALAHILYYALLILGLIVAFQSSGLNLQSITIVLGALSLGLGFGLQNVVNNFVSGIILLVERPVEVGDRIELGDTSGRVDHIGIRSTTIVTTDNIAVIVPNGDLISQRIVNWTHGDPTVRVRLPVSVAYGSDVPAVRNTLLEVARNHTGVLAHPEPTVFFSGFGDSSLDLELVVWTRNTLDRPLLFRSELNFAVEEAFRREQITMPFPQRDVHIKS